MSRKTEIVIEDGSTNGYADLGYADAAAMQHKSQLAAEITRAIKARRLPWPRRCATVLWPKALRGLSPRA